MIEPEETEPENPESEPAADKYPDRPSDNPSVLRCIRAYHRGYNRKFNETKGADRVFEAREEGKRCFLRVLPPLAGYENIRDFIACVAYAELDEIIRHSEAVHCFEAAKVALTTLRHETKPPKTAAASKK
jgi:hypothetical protein